MIYTTSESDYDNFDTYQETHPTATFSKRFFFNDFYYHNQYGDLKPRPKEERTLPDDFFVENINIQAIVGKNGSGKSSLMDLMGKLTWALDKRRHTPFWKKAAKVLHIV